MTNKLKEIQEENCKFITDRNFVIKGKLLTLNKVLIALKGLACNLCLLDVDENYNIFIRLDDPFSDVGSFYWDLTKETLEEQSEETQKEINRIINSN